jgi:hypothetical protein
MSPPVIRESRKILTSDKEILYPPNKVLNPSKIGYYGRPITKLKKDELISALTELAKMYKECEKKIKKY